MPKKSKVTIYLSEEDKELINKFADQFGLTFSGTSVIALKLGMQAMQLSTDPSMKEYFESQLKGELSEKKAN